MTPHNWAWVLLASYVLFAYSSSFVKPKKCSEHETQEQRYKRAVAAPFWTILAVGWLYGIVWAFMTLMFQ